MSQRRARRLHIALLAATTLTAAPAFADGGAGGSNGVTPGGSGGADSATATGAVGGSATGAAGGGGGGAGAIGGNGGDGGGIGPSGGPGGATAGAAGGGGTSTLADGTGAGGGGGGAHGLVTSATLNNSSASAVQGGVGGGGGNFIPSGGNAGSGGGGGGGGYGVVTSAPGAHANSGSVRGGAGGNGGQAIGTGSRGGNGGSGGIGLVFAAGASGSFSNAGSATVSGGAGGNGGAAGFFGFSADAGSAGAGGSGLIGVGVSIVNAGQINGGAGGAGGMSIPGGANGNGGMGGTGISNSGATITNTGIIAGGNGGAAGAGATAGVGGVAITGLGLTIISSGSITGGLSGDGVTRANAITFTGGTNVLELQAGSTINGTVAAVSGGSDTLRLGGSANATFDTSQIGAAAQYRDFAAYEKTGSGTWTLANTTAATTSWTITQGTLAISSDTNLGGGAGSLVLNGGTLQLASTTATARQITLNAGGGTIDTNGNNLSVAGVIAGPGGLTKNGAGSLTFSSQMTYTGGTAINAGTLALATSNSLAAGGAVGINGGILSLSGTTQTVGALSGTAGGVALGSSGTLTTDSAANTTLASQITGISSRLIKQGSGTLTLTGNNTFTGSTTVDGGGLVVNGSLASAVTVNSAAMLGGTGTIGGLVSNGGTLAPGNSIGTLTVNGNFVQTGGVYQVEVNNTGQSDRIGVSGTATINGGTVAVQAQSGIYARNTTYTIVTANGGVSGAYSTVTSNFAFLTPSLSYDANNVYLNLLQSQSAFAAGAQTANQYAVGTVLDQVNATATGNLNTVLNALSVLNTQQGPQALNQISGQPYADFGTVNVQGSALFMNAVGQQLAGFRGGLSSGRRQALAEACDADACQAAPGPWSAWVSGLGGFGNVLGNGNSQTLTYNFIGTAAGIDYRATPSVLLGIAAGYTNGQQWVDSFFGKGWSNTLNVTAYGSFTLDGFYADALAGYAYSNNQMQRQLFIPGLQPMTANGSTGANQFLGQVESGYRIPVFAPAETTVTPFARLQVASVNQAAFSEWGANALSLNVAQQATNSVRTTFGADLAASFGLGNQRTLDMGVRLGWLHEFADTGRPLTAAFAGAPGNSFTVFGATPQRDSAVIGLRASSTVAAGTQLYARYDGELGGGSDNHAFNVGVRLTW